MLEPSGIYGLVLLHLSTYPTIPDNGVVVDQDNMLVAVRRGEEILVVQVLERDLFDFVAKTSLVNPGFLVRLFEKLEKTKILPCSISIVRVNAKDLEHFRRVRHDGR